jgi:hypothetical protein
VITKKISDLKKGDITEWYIMLSDLEEGPNGFMLGWVLMRKHYDHSFFTMTHDGEITQREFLNLNLEVKVWDDPFDAREWTEQNKWNLSRSGL